MRNTGNLYVSFQEGHFTVRHDFQVLGCGREQDRLTGFQGNAVTFIVGHGTASFHADVDDERIQFTVVHRHVDRGGEIRTAD